MLRKISEDYDSLSGCDDIDLSDIVTTLLASLPADCHPAGNVIVLLRDFCFIKTLNDRRNLVKVGAGSEGSD